MCSRLWPPVRLQSTEVTGTLHNNQPESQSVDKRSRISRVHITRAAPDCLLLLPYLELHTQDAGGECRGHKGGNLQQAALRNERELWLRVLTSIWVFLTALGAVSLKPFEQDPLCLPSVIQQWLQLYWVESPWSHSQDKRRRNSVWSLCAPADEIEILRTECGARLQTELYHACHIAVRPLTDQLWGRLQSLKTNVSAVFTFSNCRCHYSFTGIWNEHRILY